LRANASVVVVCFNFFFFASFFRDTNFNIMAITEARNKFEPYAFGAGISHKDTPSQHNRDESTGSFWNSPDMAERDSVSVFRTTTGAAAVGVPSPPPPVASRYSGADSPEDLFRAPSFVFSRQRPTPEPFTDLFPTARLQRESSIRWSESQSSEVEHSVSSSEGTSGFTSAAPAAAIAGVAAGEVAKNEGQREKTLSSSSHSSGGTTGQSTDSSHLDPFLDTYNEGEEEEDPYRRSDLTILAQSSENDSGSFRSTHTLYSTTWDDDAPEMTIDRVNAMDFGEIDGSSSQGSRQRDSMDTDVAFAYDGIDGKRTSDPFGN
jgi:hypothetical protein